ncbi:fibronectin type III domain-containing protein [Pimelobacter simplex]|uniref:fibronectin type III domain-containing protein n=1 Tax=Nocardioides simplex TaxID=2045 RepID=UPI00214F8A26|nr:fibronectin type III domain-containing protein [Pimelobacter simplex]UUW89583.1 fibronectin type III domain-containing protein [Pimelobacter simplex]UUW93412.1 fibronectin type III domain-containing protein [Pimelobacter simplex]
MVFSDRTPPRARRARRAGRTALAVSVGVAAAVALAAPAATAVPMAVPSAVPATSPCADGTTPALLSSVSCATAGTYTLGVPSGTTDVDLEVVGAGGGAGYPARQHIGGDGAEVTGSLTLPVGTAYLHVVVGAGGGGNNNGKGYGGGGSGIFALDGNQNLIAKLAIAGAGGGGAYNGDGGNAGSAGTAENVTFAAPGQPAIGGSGGAGGVGNYNAGVTGASNNPAAPTVASGGAGGAYPNGSVGGSGGGGYAGGGGGGAGSQGILNVYTGGGGGGSSLASAYLSGASIAVRPGTGGIQLPGLIAGDGATGSVTMTFNGLAVPGVPTGVSATRKNGAAEVSFSAPASDGGSAITSYTVSASPGDAFRVCPGSPCTVSGLDNGTAYTFTVRASSANGDSDESAPSAAVTPATTPGSPTGVSAQPGDGEAQVSFAAPADHGGAAVTSYTVTADPGPATATCSVSPCTVADLTNGTAYRFSVVATNDVGGSAPSALSAAVTPSGRPGVPTAVSATPRDGAAEVSFTAPAGNGGSAVTSYTVSAAPGDASQTCAGSPCTVDGLDNGTAYTFTVHATNANGDSDESTPSAAVTPVAVPGAPTDVSAQAGDGEAEVSFTAPTKDGGTPITSYTVTAAPGGATETCAGSPCTVGGLDNGRAYTFTVQATNDHGDSAASDPSAAVTPQGAPGTPTGVSAKAGDRRVAVTFSAPQSDGGSPVTAYTVTVSPGGATTSCPGSPCTVGGLTNGTAYRVTVRATNAKGDSDESAPSAAVTPVAPAPPVTPVRWYRDPLTKAERQKLVPVPAHPARATGPLRATKALHRTRNGTLAVPARQVRGHQLGARQGVQVTGLFRFDSARLTPAGRRQLVVLARSLENVRALTCEGYADYAGSVRRERVLAKQRAKAVCAVLKSRQRGIEVRTVGFGPSRPAMIGGNAHQREVNRRVALLVRR